MLGNCFDSFVVVVVVALLIGVIWLLCMLLFRFFFVFIDLTLVAGGSWLLLLPLSFGLLLSVTFVVVVNAVVLHENRHDPGDSTTFLVDLVRFQRHFWQLGCCFFLFFSVFFSTFLFLFFVLPSCRQLFYYAVNT